MNTSLDLHTHAASIIAVTGVEKNKEALWRVQNTSHHLPVSVVTCKRRWYAPKKYHKQKAEWIHMKVASHELHALSPCTCIKFSAIAKLQTSLPCRAIMPFLAACDRLVRPV